MTEPLGYSCRTEDCPLCGVEFTATAAASLNFSCARCHQPLVAVTVTPWPAGLAPEALPTYLAHPWAAYWQESHPRVKLSWLIDAAELSVRWSVAVALAEVLHAHGGVLPEAVLDRVRAHVERPTLGRWLEILRTLSEHRPAQPLLAPEIFDLYRTTVEPTFFGTDPVTGREAPEGRARVERSLLALRNRVVHGGGLSTARAQALVAAQGPRLEALVRAAVQATAGTEVIALREGRAERLQGLDPEAVPIPSGLAEAAEGVWLVGEAGCLLLVPLLTYGPVLRLGADGQLHELPGDPAAQVYVRAERDWLSYLPLGREEAYAESQDIAAFRALFRLDVERPAPRRAAVDGFRWDDFLREARVLAEELVENTREAELARLKGWLKGRDTRQAGVAAIGWLHGAPGIGKSLLMARLAADLANAPAERQRVFHHRFRGGDARNSRQAMLRLLQAALWEWAPLAAVTSEPGLEVNDGQALIDDLRQRLGALASLTAPKGPAPRLVMVLDGLDEVVASDPGLPNLLRQLALPGSVWLLAGRAEYGLNEAFSGPGCEILFEGDGLPAMSEPAIRAMLLDGLGHTRSALIARDKDRHDEQGKETIRNAFIERVVQQARGLPLYVHLLLEDLRSGRLTVHDEDKLPAGLTAYYDALLQRLGVSDVQRDLPLIVALLARAEEPLERTALAQLCAGCAGDAARFESRVEAALRAGWALVRRASTPEGGRGFTLYHQSFRDYVGGVPARAGRAAIPPARQLAGTVAEAEQRLWEPAESWAELSPGNLRNHLFRWGTHYALAWQGEAGVQAVLRRLTDFAYLQARTRGAAGHRGHPTGGGICRAVAAVACAGAAGTVSALGGVSSGTHPFAATGYRAMAG